MCILEQFQNLNPSNNVPFLAFQISNARSRCSHPPLLPPHVCEFRVSHSRALELIYLFHWTIRHFVYFL